MSLPWMPFGFSRGSQRDAAGSGGGGGGGSTEYNAFIARTSGLDGTHTSAYQALIDGLVSDGIFSLTDQLLVFATQDSTTALLNLVSTSFTASTVGSPTFTADAGYSKSGSTSRINTNFNASTSGVNYGAIQAGAGVYTLDSWGSGVDSGAALGFISGTDSSVAIYPHFSDNNIYYNPQDGIVGQSKAYTSGTHFIGFASISSTVRLYQNGASSTESFFGGTALANSNFSLLGDNFAGGRVYNGTISAWWVGQALTAVQAGNLYSRLAAYMTSVHGSA